MTVGEAVAAERGATAEGTARWRVRLGAVDPWTWAWVAFGLVTLVVVVANDAGVFAPDTKPELYLNPDRLLRRALSAWQADPQLGQANYNTGILPVAAVMAALQVLGLPPWLLQRLVMTVLLVVGAIGMGVLVTRLTGRRGAGPWLAGIVHAWHPWTVVGAATLPVRLPHAVLPWALVATHRALVEQTWRSAALAALAFGAMAGINGGVVNLMMLVPLGVLVLWLAATRQVTLSAVGAGVARIGVLSLGMGLYWLVPSLVSIGTGAGSVLAATEDPAAIGHLSPASEVVRGMGMWTSYIVIDGQVENPEQLAFLTSGAVVAAGFLVMVLAVLSLAGLDRRVRALCITMGGLGIGLMLGLNTSGGATPLGRAMAWAFEQWPALQAFRTTNKWGAMLVVAVALAIGGGLDPARWGLRPAVARRPAIVAVVAVVVVAAGPLVPGQLHPLQVPVPDYWFTAAAATDTRPATIGDDPAGDRASHRLLLLPGNAQTRYLWGYRGVDDLDTALWDHRSVVWRSTIPQGSPPATNMLTAFDVGLEQATLSPAGMAFHTRLLGADQALVRTDTDWLRNHGRPTSEVLREVTANPAVDVAATFGPTASERGVDAAVVDGADPALTLVDLPPPAPAAMPLRDALLVAGDAAAVDGLARAGFDPVADPLLWVDELDDAQLAAGLATGGRIVLTDTNQRRRWAISSLTDSHSPVLPAATPVAAADQRSRTFDPDSQTVAVPTDVTVTASPDPWSVIRLRAAGHPALAYDGNLATGWQYGTRTDGVGGWLELTSARPGRVAEVQVVVGTDGKAITQVRITTGDRSVVVPVVDGAARAQVEAVTDTIRITITDTFGFTTAPASIREVLVSGDPAAWQPLAPTLRLPRVLSQRASANPDLAASMARAETTLVLARLAGNPDDPFDDEEARLRRTWDLPWDVRLAPAATTGLVTFLEDVPAGECREIAQVGDGQRLHALAAAPTGPARAGEPTAVRGCGTAVDLPAGTWTLVASELVAIDHLAVGTSPTGAPSAGPVPPEQAGTSAGTRTQVSETSARVTLPASAEPTVVSSGQAWDPGWRAVGDDADLGPPVVVQGWAAGWIVPAGVTEVAIDYRPQRATRIAQWLSLAAALGAVAIVGAGGRPQRWRRNRERRDGARHDGGRVDGGRP